MPELPEIARQKLKQAEARSGAHPDAGLLTAFAEQSLTAGERARVLDHLAACAACRDILALALPEQVAAPAQAAVRPGWWHWSALRWGAVAATAVVVVGAVWIVSIPNLLRSRMAVSSEVRQLPPAATPSAPAPVAGEPVQAAKAADKTAGDRDVLVAAAPNPNAARRKDAGAAAAPGPIVAGAQPATTVAAASTKPALQGALRAGSSPNAEDMDRLKALETEGKASAPAPSVPSMAMKAAVVAKAQSADAGLARSAVAMPKNQRAELAKTAAEAPAAEVQNGIVGGLVLSKNAPAAGIGTGSGGGIVRDALKTAVRWTISSTGALQRSFNGRDWQDVAVADGVIFRAVSALDTEVWAGGNGGALYHSSDAGQTWTRVRPEYVTDEWTRRLAGDVTEIRFNDPLHGTIITRVGSLVQAWTTADGGKTWTFSFVR